MSDERFGELDPDFQYTWNGYRYGVGRAELSRRLDGARVGLIVVRDPRTIRELATSVPGIDIVAVLVTANTSTRRQRLIGAGLDEREIARRLAREEDATRDESSTEEFHRIISEMIAGAPGGKPTRATF